MATMKPQQCNDEGDTAMGTMKLRQQRHHNNTTAMTTPQQCDNKGDTAMAMTKLQLT